MSEKRTRRPGELIFAILIGVFSVIALWQAFQISQFTGLSTPGIFPMLAAATMLVSALFIFKETRARPNFDSGTERFLKTVMPVRLVCIVALVVAYVWAMPWLGFMLSSAIFLFAAIAFLWRKNVFISAALAGFTLAVIYVIFRILFQVVLPKGTLLQGLY